MTHEYEFTAAENRVIGALAVNTRIAGALNILAGVVLLAIAVVIGVGDTGGSRVQLVSGAIVDVALTVFTILIGVWMIKAAGVFRQIISTEGSDITLLMRAFKQLTQVYRTTLWVGVSAFVIGAVAAIVNRLS